jgi:pyrimidine operon attenuation protein/uracil phosphoribosyltransferase
MSAGGAPGETILLDAAGIAALLGRFTEAIAVGFGKADDLCLVGIKRRGDVLARRLQASLAARLGRDLPLGSLDITLYRDDLRLRGVRALSQTDLPPDGVDDKTVILVDDVLFSGRTIRAALDALSDLGRPKQVQLAVLVDRGHRELPIRADYVGKNLPTNQKETVRVQLSEIDGRDEVVIST